MVQVLNTEDERVILRLKDGTIMFVHDEYLQLKAIPGRKRTETKTMEYGDLLVINDAIRKVYPEVPVVYNVKAAAIKIVTGLEKWDGPV